MCNLKWYKELATGYNFRWKSVTYKGIVAGKKEDLAIAIYARSYEKKLDEIYTGAWSWDPCICKIVYKAEYIATAPLGLL